MLCHAHAAGISRLGHMRQLESLNLSGLGQLDDEGLAGLAQLLSLQELVANRCPQLRCRIPR